MKTAAAVLVLVVMPLGFFVLAAMIVNRMLAKRRQQRSDRTQTLSASTQEDGTSHPSALLLCGLELDGRPSQASRSINALELCKERSQSARMGGQ